MNAQWEQKFTAWAQPPSKTEAERCENALRAIRAAISKSEKLKSRSLKVFVQGSYRNNVNVKQDSDIDVGVMCHDYFLTQYPPGKSDADFGNTNVDYTFRQFKDELEQALVEYFGRKAVTRGNKAFDLHETSYHVEADIAPFFEFRHYAESGFFVCGVALLPDSGSRIENFPERLLDTWPRINLHYENGVAKNDATGRAFKSVVRILKSLRNEMDEMGIAAAKPIPGFLLECLAWNTPDSRFTGSTWDKIVQAVLSFLWSSMKMDDDCAKWCEVNDIKFLFHPAQKWTRVQAYDFIDAAWSYVGVR